MQVILRQICNSFRFYATISVFVQLRSFLYNSLDISLFHVLVGLQRFFFLSTAAFQIFSIVYHYSYECHIYEPHKLLFFDYIYYRHYTRCQMSLFLDLSGFVTPIAALRYCISLVLNTKNESCGFLNIFFSLRHIKRLSA